MPKRVRHGQRDSWPNRTQEQVREAEGGPLLVAAVGDP